LQITGDEVALTSLVEHENVMHVHGINTIQMASSKHMQSIRKRTTIYVPHVCKLDIPPCYEFDIWKTPIDKAANI
jgi:hypothetical protein